MTEKDESQTTDSGRLARIERMVGRTGLERLRQSHVTVVGLGAVGSYAVEALARAGVGHLRLVDFDEVRPSNINRQLYALCSTVGQAKAELARQRVADINPDCRVEALRTFVHVETMEDVLGGRVDLLVDAIDSLAPKLALLTAALERGIAVLSSMGAARRTDPCCVRVGPLSGTRHCPLARFVRKHLRRRGLPLRIPCVYSVEPVADLPETVLGEAAESEDILVRGRPRRTLGSLPTLTGIFGLTLANEALRMLTGDAWPGASAAARGSAALG